MKIVIDINESLYDLIQKEVYINGMRSGKTLLQKLYYSFANGTPLPKGHGDLIDRKELLKAIDTWDKFGVDDTNSLFRLDNLSLPHYVPYIHYDDMVKSVKGAETIIEAESEEKE